MAYLFEKIMIVVSSSPQASIRDRYGNNPLHIACSNGDLSCVERILVAPKASEFASKKAHSQFFTSIDLEQWNYDGE
jgi:ankyrin repeat protein